MNDDCKTPEATPSPEADLHTALTDSIRAILRMHAAAVARLDPDKIAEIDRRLADHSGKLALFVTLDGNNCEVSIALIKSEIKDVFEQHLLKINGPIVAAAVAPEAVKAINLRKLN